MDNNSLAFTACAAVVARKKNIKQIIMAIKDYSQPFKYCVYEDIAKKILKIPKLVLKGGLQLTFVHSWSGCCR